MDRLAPKTNSKLGRNRLSVPVIEEEKSLLDTTGDFLLSRAKKFSSSIGADKPLVITDDTGKRRLDREQAEKVLGSGLGFGPSSLPNVVRQSVTAGVLKTGAQKVYSQALGATKQKFKSLSDKVVPELIKRNVTAFTRPGLLAKAERELAEAGQSLETVISNIPKDTKVATRGIVNSLGRYKNYFTVISGGKRVILNQSAYDNVTKLQNTIKELGSEVSFDTLRKTRQIMDEVVTQGGKAFGRTLEEGSRIDATREAGNAIRRLISKKFPEVAKVNAEYTFWKNVDDILKETIERTKSQQEPIGEKLAEGAGAVAGAVGGGIGKAVTGAIAFKWIKKIINSTGFRTISAVAKDRVADLIAQGKFGEASEFIRRSLSVGSVKLLGSEEK